MPNSIVSMIPDLQAAFQLEPEEMAGIVIQYLNALAPNDQQQLNRHNFLTYWGVQGCPRESLEKLQIALAEAWA